MKIKGIETRSIWPTKDRFVEVIDQTKLPFAFATSADAPACHECGSIMVRNAACYKCLNCGATSGCS